MDYNKLRDFLKAEQWRAADAETLAVMLKIAGRKQEGFLDPYSIQRFPCSNLCIIDELWTEFSQGHFGFSIQEKIYLDCEAASYEYGSEFFIWEEHWRQFGMRVGWTIDSANWKRYCDITFDRSANPGHLPYLPFGCRIMQEWLWALHGRKLFERRATCRA